MRKYIGILLIIAGISLTGLRSYDWMLGLKQVTHIESKDLHTEPINVTSNTESTRKPNVEKNHDYQKGEKIADLIIPSIDSKFPVWLGTDSAILKKGAGMYQSKWTTLPSDRGHTVISGHRDTIFRGLKNIKEGDELIVSFDNELYQYIVNKIWITKKDDHSVIVQKEQPTLTLTTCYPFYFVGNAPNRYIIQALYQDRHDTSTTNVTQMKTPTNQAR
ncbi:class D sortase [Bacillus sp. USDA818B3_A]|uniref:class D sortase n=1 Tax=Bacillus sp. USDA818B3_A TaxID=2698834 RepID=UPI00136F71AC|nr:class D sortase [Bacillus sp. USDA818B3_A]